MTAGLESFVVAQLLRQVLADREAGLEYGAEEYAARFPGHEALIAAEFDRLQGDATPTTAPTSATGRTIGRYTLLHELGRGAQGTVYAAADPQLERRVAIKIISTLGAFSEPARLRFVREATTASQLDHPGICPVHDFGHQRDALYIVMPLLSGRTLAEAIARSATEAAAKPCVALPDDGHDDPVNRVLAMVESIARALHHAHEHGLVHRDIKPGNIVLDEDGRSVILDFGLARNEQVKGAVLTRSGELMGTPAYLAPEQLRAKTTGLDPRTDVYALGVTLYECLTLRRPFAAATREALYDAVLTQPLVDPRVHHRGLPEDVVVILETVLEKDVDRRYQSALVLAEDLRRARQRQPIAARPAGPWLRLQRFCERSPAVAATVGALVVALSVIGYLFAVVSSERSRAEHQVANWERLADGRRLAALLREADGELWPIDPSKEPAFDAWLTRSAALLARLDAHRRTMRAVRERALDDIGEPATTWQFADPRDALMHEELQTLVAGLERLSGAPRPEEATVAGIERRRDRARQMRARLAGEHRELWRAAIEAVAAQPAFAGLRLEPLPGLVPLGPDPHSGLWEFADTQTGVPPVRGADGALQLHDDSGLVLVLVPGGSPGVGAPFLISKYEMTQGQWLRVRGANPSTQLGDRQSLLLPVETVTWQQCRETLRRLGMRLPTEAEWEHACRGGSSTAFYYGDDDSAVALYENTADETFRRLCARNGLHAPPCERDDGFELKAPIGSLRANGFGLHDTLGNVTEWCADAIGPENGDRTLRIRRGGAFWMVPARCAERHPLAADDSGDDVGLRPAREWGR